MVSEVMSIYYVAGIPYSDELYHHGVKGQKWGIRRFQNPDGTLTAEGKARYGEGENGIKNFYADRQNQKRMRIEKTKKVAKAVGTVALLGASIALPIVAGNAVRTYGSIIRDSTSLLGKAFMYDVFNARNLKSDFSKDMFTGLSALSPSIANLVYPQVNFKVGDLETVTTVKHR